MGRKRAEGLTNRATHLPAVVVAALELDAPGIQVVSDGEAEELRRVEVGFDQPFPCRLQAHEEGHVQKEGTVCNGGKGICRALRWRFLLALQVLLEREEKFLLGHRYLFSETLDVGYDILCPLLIFRRMRGCICLKCCK